MQISFYDFNHILGFSLFLSLRYVYKCIVVRSKEKISIKFRIWFFIGENKLIGKGRVELLELIRETGSISNAAKVMKMSYRQAWQMVQEMNERSMQPVVEKQLGGKAGGGATVTARGEQLIAAFHQMEKNVRVFIDEETKRLKI